MPLDAEEFAPSDGLWDLVGVAADRGAARLADPAGWVLVVSERERREGEPPEPEWGNPGARFDTGECQSVDDGAPTRARSAWRPGGAWRAAVVWRERDRLLIEAQDAETDSLAGRFARPDRAPEAAACARPSRSWASGSSPSRRRRCVPRRGTARPGRSAPATGWSPSCA